MGARKRLATLALLLALLPCGARAVEIGGPFVLTDQHGIARTDAEFRGSLMLIYFGFTHCPDTCPTTLLKVAHALAELAPDAAAQVVPIFITVDPARDTPELLADYAALFDPRLVALTGPEAELAELQRRYGVFAARVPTATPGDYLVDHTGFLYLLGRDGRYLAHFESDASEAELVAALDRALRG
jgi:protein SCO1/2